MSIMDEKSILLNKEIEKIVDNLRTKKDYKSYSLYLQTALLYLQDIDKEIKHSDIPRSYNYAKQIGEFNKYLQKIFAFDEEAEGIPLDKRTKVVSYGVDDEINDSMRVTVRLVNRENGLFSRGKAGSGGVRAVRPVDLHVYDDPETSSMFTINSVHLKENYVEICAWGQSPEAAEDLVERLEDIMEEYIWYFNYEGFGKITYEKRGRDIVKDVGGGSHRSYGRPLYYYIQTQKIRERKATKLRKLFHYILVDKN